MSDQLIQDLDKLYADGKAQIEAWVQELASKNRDAALKKLEAAIQNTIASVTSAGILANIEEDAAAAVKGVEGVLGLSAPVTTTSTPPNAPAAPSAPGAAPNPPTAAPGS
jgi:L-lactate utilization protein LutB